MSKRFLSVFAAATFLTAAPALACTSLQEAMGQFEEVKNAYVAKAPTMSPEQFPIWTGYLEKFGTAMGQSDFAGACAALSAASTELGFANAAAAAVAAPAQPAASTTEEVAAPAPAPAPSAEAAQAASGSGQSGGLLGGGQSGQGGGLTGGGQGQASASQPQPQQTPVAAAAEPVWVECPRGRCGLRN
ncbi:MAG: hypothetical protein AAGB15_02350 [Pseudomonadota bacterium]